MTGDQPAGALTGLNVLDLTQVAAGPYATMLLADMGADVIKVERPGSGDAIRHAEIRSNTVSGYYLGLNKGKRSIALDLQTAHSRGVILSLARWADVVVENFRPGAVDRLGIGYHDLRAVNEQIIYCSISGFGPSGPLRGRPALDVIAQALAGVMDITGEADRAPAKCGAPISDLSSGAFAVIGILAALNYREKTGEGQHVETSLLGSTLGLLASYIPAAALGTHFTRVGSAHNTVSPYQAFRGSDDQYFILAVGSDQSWRRAASAMELAELAGDLRFAKNVDRVRRREELASILQERFNSEPASVWVERFLSADVPASEVYSLTDVVSATSFREAGYITDIKHPDVGSVPVTVAPLVFSRTPVRGDKPAPSLNQHEDEILELVETINHEGRDEALA